MSFSLFMLFLLLSIYSILYALQIIDYIYNHVSVNNQLHISQARICWLDEIVVIFILACTLKRN